jgi:hypothetical protein
MSIPAEISGINLKSAYKRETASGSFTGIEYVNGGWITVEDKTQLDNIYLDRISTGQIAYVSSSNELYIARQFDADWSTFPPGEARVEWFEFNFPGGAGFPFSGSAIITGSLLVSASFIDFTNATVISGSIFSGSFVGDGSGLTGIASSLYLTGSTGKSVVNLKDQGLVLTGSTDGIIVSISNTTASFTISDEAVISGSFSGSFQGLIDNALTASYSLTASYFTGSHIDFTPLSDAQAPPYREGRVWYDADNGALAVYNDEADITLQVGQEFYVRVYNNSTSLIANGTPVYISGSQGDYPYIWPATAEDHTTGAHFDNHIMGLATHDIEASSAGYVTRQGIVRNIDTTAFAAGDELFLQTGSAGLRNTPPPFPYDVVQVGFVIRSQANGFVFVQPKEPVHFNNISGLSGSGAAENHDLWVYDGSNNAWYNTHSGLELSGSFSGSFQGQITSSGLNVNGDVTILGDLTVYGSSSFVHVTSSQLDVDAAFISVNVFEPVERFGGLRVYDSGSQSHLATASLAWDSERNHWIYMNASGSTYSGGGLISGPRNTGSMGQEQYPSLNYVVRGQGGDHIYDSNIYDDDTTVTVFIDLGVTGSTEIKGDLTLPNISNAGADPTKFLVISESAVQYRNAAQLAADLDVLSGNAITGLQNEIAYFSDDSVISGSQNFVYNFATGRMGINTSAPNAKLEIVDSSPTSVYGAHLILQSSEDYGGLDSGSRLLFNTYVSESNRSMASIQGFKENETRTDYDGYLSFSTRQNGSALAEKMRISSEGNVGIGAIVTPQKLTVQGNISASGLIYAPNIGAGVDNSVVVLDSDGTLRTDEIDSKVWTGALVSGSGTTNRVTYWTDSDTLGADDTFFFDGTSVGINTTSPAYKLDVNTGNIRVGVHTFGSGSAATTASLAIGQYALASYTGSAENTAVGWTALQSIESQGPNDAFGGEALRYAVDASYNVGFGYAAGYRSQGTQNTFIGQFAGPYYYNLTGGNNTMIGTLSGLLMSGSAASNTAIGASSMYNFATADNNTAVGNAAGYNLTTGGGNTFIGRAAGSGITTGNNNTIIGRAQSLSSTLSGTIIIADGNNNQRIYVNNVGNVGIGTTNPTGLLNLHSNAASMEADGLVNITGGVNAVFNSTERFIFNIDSDSTQTDRTFDIAANRSGSAGGKLIFRVQENGNVGINAASPSAQLHVSGAVRFESYGLGNITGSVAKTLGVDADGNVIELASSTDGLGSGSYVAYWNDENTLTGSGDFTWTNSVLTIDGTLEATEKSFNIAHPTQPGKRLIYGVLEGPEHGVYCRGKISGEVIELPEEWTGLVHEDSITVQLTPIGRHQSLYIVDIRDNKIFIKNGDLLSSKINAYYYIQGTRKDTKPLQTVRDK